MKKEIIITSEIFPNYNGHLLGVAKIGFDSEYSKLYKKTILRDDLEFLTQNKNLIKWGDGFLGKFTIIFVFFPNYINLENKSEISKYFQLLNESIEQKSFKKFNEHYKIYLNNLKDWTGYKLKPDLFDYKYEIRRISDIYLNNYDTFISDVWQIEKEKVENKVQILNEQLSKYDFIQLWEKFTGIEFKYPFYKIILGTGIKNGSTANSLGYEKNWFYYGSDIDWFIQFICHETGTHILFDLLLTNIKKFKGKDNPLTEEFTIYYKGFENLCSFYNQIILAKIGIKYNYKMPDYNSNNFFNIFSSIYHSNLNISAKELYHKGINEYKIKVCSQMKV
ncbi:MAG: hypothetical protein K8R49_02675 [Candidatus Cloacimonetes bacterium]|nr:hypothetical protein [Candidatus Cloacimonadota bacterium]